MYLGRASTVAGDSIFVASGKPLTIAGDLLVEASHEIFLRSKGGGTVCVDRSCV